MNLVILGIMALCGASVKSIAIAAIVLGGFDLLSNISESINNALEDYIAAFKQKEDENGDE
jgi:hypothetical protein